MNEKYESSVVKLFSFFTFIFVYFLLCMETLRLNMLIICSIFYIGFQQIINFFLSFKKILMVLKVPINIEHNGSYIMILGSEEIREDFSLNVRFSAYLECKINIEVK